MTDEDISKLRAWVAKLMIGKRVYALADTSCQGIVTESSRDDVIFCDNIVGIKLRKSIDEIDVVRYS